MTPRRRSAPHSFIYLTFFASLALRLPVFAASPAARLDPDFTAFFRRTNGWEAGDVATSVPLSDGRVLWLFGDSYIDQLDPATGTTPCIFNARNALLLQDPADPQHPVTLRSNSGVRTFFVPPDAPSSEPWPCFWPGAGFQHGDTIWISLVEQRKTPKGGMWGFRADGQYWAALKTFNLTNVAYTKLPSLHGIIFWCGFVPDPSNACVYAYGNQRRGTESDVYAARFPIDDPAAPWSFWNGNTWVSNPAQATPITRATSTSVNICRIKSKYLLLTTEFSVACDQGRQIFLATSERPTGPFSPLQSIYTIDDLRQGHQPFFYAANAHPESITSQNQLLITYCINGYAPCLPACDKNNRFDPDTYRPRAIRLPLP